MVKRTSSFVLGATAFSAAALVTWHFLPQSLQYRLLAPLVRKVGEVASQSFAAGLAMVTFESGPLLRASKESYLGYSKEPGEYGFNELPEEEPQNSPLLLVPGAVGSWPYLGPLGSELLGRGFPVFVVNLEPGGPTEEGRQHVQKEVEEIRKQYLGQYNKETEVDLIAHSMGANTAIAAALHPESLRVLEGELVLGEGELKGQDGVGRVVALANPSDEQEVSWMKNIGKTIFNVIAEFDLLMEHKKCALDIADHVTLPARHIDIVYHPEVAQKVADFLTVSKPAVC